MCKISKKNIFASLLAVSMIFTMMSTTVVHAQSVKDGSNEVTVTPNVGVSYVSPEETIETRGTSRPSKVWNIKSKGQYDFAGSSHSFEFSNIKSDTEFYIVFEGNGYSFSGHVK